MKIKNILLMILSTFLVNILHSQNLDKILAEFGNQKITIKDFIIRYELSPFVSHRSRWNQDTIKTDFLFSMVAERLWYLDASEKGFTNTEDFKFYFKPIQDIFLRDYLFKQEIEEKIKLSPEDLNSAINKAQFKLKSKIINSEDSTKVFKIYELLKEGTQLDSVLKIPEYAFLSSGEFDITLGSLKDEEVEDYLFALKPEEFSKPIKSEIGWVIFYIIEKSFTPIDISDQKVIENIKSTFRSRRIMIKAQEYLRNLLGNQIYNIDDTVFNEMFEVIYETIIHGMEKSPDSIHPKYVLNDIE